ncbi:MAG: autoinducer binding domain-containing protein [Alphaproteobacteria bacterium]|nr:autoinducer binding domain-containing protein [Alphaproteobacteria bacterium]
MAGKILTSLPSDIEKNLLALTNNLRELGVTHIGHGLIVGSLKPTAFFSCKEWAERYDDEDLVSRDPIRACALKTNFKIIPWEYIPSNKEQRPVIEERKREFCSKTGLLISIKNKEFHETFVFGTDSKKHDITHFFSKNSRVLIENLLMFRKEHMRYYTQSISSYRAGAQE